MSDLIKERFIENIHNNFSRRQDVVDSISDLNNKFDQRFMKNDSQISAVQSEVGACLN